MQHNAFEYLSLIERYWSKNGKYIRIRLELLATPQGNFLDLLKSSHMNKKWLTLVFKLANQSKVEFDESILTKGLQYCGDQSDAVFEQYAQQIKNQIEYQQKLHQMTKHHTMTSKLNGSS